LNGATFSGCGAYIGDENGVPLRNRLVVFEDTEHNQSTSSGYWRETFEIKPEMFGAEKVLVHFWFGDHVDETYILIAEANNG
jgi:hypothetical protein